MSELTIAISDLQEEQAIALARERLAAGVPALDIVEECRTGLISVKQTGMECPSLVEQRNEGHGRRFPRHFA